MTEEKKNYSITDYYVFKQVFSDPAFAKELVRMALVNDTIALNPEELEIVTDSKSFSPDVWLKSADYFVELRMVKEKDFMERFHYLVEEVNARKEKDGDQNLTSLFILLCMHDPLGMKFETYHTFNHVNGGQPDSSQPFPVIYLNMEDADDTDGTEMSDFLYYAKTGTVVNGFTRKIDEAVQEINKKHTCELIREEQFLHACRREGFDYGAIQGVRETISAIISRMRSNGFTMKQIRQTIGMSEESIANHLFN